MLELLNAFNSNYDKYATIYKKQYEHDLDGAYTISFYEMLTEQPDPSLGFYKVKLVGGYHGGPYYEDSYTDVVSGFFITNGREEKGYPISHNKISIGELRVDYKSTKFDLNIFESTKKLNRFWISDLEIIKNKYPELAQQVQERIEAYISYLAGIQKQHGYKSTWVYYRFQEKLLSMNILVNGEILKNTCYFYSSQAHYNSASHKLISLSERERLQFKQEVLHRPD